MPADDLLLRPDEIEHIREADGDHEITWVDDDIARGVTVHQILDAYEALRGILAEVLDTKTPVRHALPDALLSRAADAARGAGGR